MRCIHCGSDTKGKDRRRNGGRCAGCHHEFAFDPLDSGHNPQKITDMRFQRMISQLSAEGTVFFTEEQFWYEHNRHVRAWYEGIFRLLRLRRARGAPRVSRQTFSELYLRRWIATHGRIERLLGPPERPAARRDAGGEPDLTTYSFDRAVITDRAPVAAMLIANNFHFENNCAVLSVGGYPGDIFETVRTMLRRNPKLEVYALHDASVSGCVLPLTLRRAEWFPDSAIRILDLGLRPRHVKAIDLFTHSGSPLSAPAELHTLLAADEIAWLEAGNSADLAAVRPVRLMRSIFQGFGRARAPDAETADSGSFLPSIWIFDSGSDVYAADSFG
jgi:hypothetical protein